MTTHRPVLIPRAVSILLALSGAAYAQFTAAPGSPFAVGSHPQAVAVGDFNGDGKLDFAVANEYSNNVTVLLGNGTGGFAAAPGSPFTVGQLPISVAVGDFNGDGKPDLAVANLNDNTVTVLLGNGTGGFAAAPGSPFTVGSGPTSVVLGDFNGDGKPDLAIANEYDGTVTVLLGNGTGGFTAALGSPFMAGTAPVSVAVGDFNGDGKPDLAIVNNGSNNVVVLLGNGAGGFTAAPGSPFTVGSGPTSVAVGDFNRDGKPDLAVTNEYDGTVTVLLGSGTGGFTAAPGSPFPVGGTEPLSVAVGDFNGDGNPDLAIANGGSNNVTVLLGDGTGGFTPTGSPFPAGSGPSSVAVGDFNGDGNSDLAIANAGSNNVTLLLGAKWVWFTEAPGSPFTAGSGPTSVAVGDFNGDGNPDLAIANRGSSNVTVLLGNGGGWFTAAPGSPFTLGLEPCSVAVGDFNGDGKLDLVAIANYFGSNVMVLLGNGLGGFTPAPSSPFTMGSIPASVAVGDFNGDGKLDLAFNSVDSVTVLLGNGLGGFTPDPGSPFPVGTAPFSVAVGDFNGDGKLDLAVANYSDNNVTVLLGNGTGGFTAAPGSPFAVGTEPVFVAVGDFNGDGKPDLAILNGNSTITVLLGNGSGGFTEAPGSPFPAGTAAVSVAVGDFNGDAKLDLAIANAQVCNFFSRQLICYDGGVTVLVGNGTGGFTEAAGSPFPAESGANYVAVGDFNGDGKPDLAIVNSSGTVTVLLNSPSPPPTLLSPSNGATGVPLTPTLNWNASDGATSYNVYLGTSSSPPFVANTVTDVYVPGTLASGTTYYWNVVAKHSRGLASSATWSFTTQPALPAAPVLTSPANGATGVSFAPTLVWSASTWAASYDVYFGTASAPVLVTTATGTSYAPGTLSADTTYYWRIVAQNSFGSASSATWSFTTGVPAVGLRFVPVAPCRVADTRNTVGPFGGPTMAGGSSRSFAVPQSGCGIPSTAQAYSLNVTVVPQGPLGFLTAWPTGSPQPFVSTLNSWEGAVVANAAIVPAGTNGAISIYVMSHDPTDVILDINGYFDSSDSANSYAFYPATPCRVADTRGAIGLFGGPSMFASQTRDFPIPLSPCGIPSTARAYALNVTVVPDTDYLGYLTTWPTGQAQPNVSTLNSWTGKVVANAAIVPAGTNESISVFVSNPTDVILDINGYFGLPGNPDALSFYPITPCRVADTRNPDGPLGGPEMAANTARSFAIPASSCNVPTTAAAYSLNVTVMPDGPLGFLTAWPTGQAQPNVSTLNSWDGSVVANAAIVPAGTNGAISIYVMSLEPTHVILDINGYFAP